MPFDKQKPYLAWVPLLAAYTGARQNEICQLLTTDIKEENGIHYFNISNKDDDGKVVKRLKNESSKRKVPVHNTLIELGFLDFVNHRKEAGGIVLFEKNSKREPLKGADYTRIHQRFNKKITSDDKKVFHSYRHLFQNELKQRGVPLEVYHSIVGHSSDNKMDKVYTDDYSLPIKYEALIKLEYPTLDLMELKRKYKDLLTI